MGIRPLARRARTVFQHLASGDSDSVDDETIEQRIVRENRRQEKGSLENSIHPSRSYSDSGSWNDQPAETVQHGVQDVEAVTMTWSKTTLILIFVK